MMAMRHRRGVLLAALPLVLGGCGNGAAWLPGAGPSREATLAAPAVATPGAAPGAAPAYLVEMDEPAARRLAAAMRQSRFAELFTEGAPAGLTIGAGDMVEVTVWEAPPATLFSSTIFDPRAGATTTRQATFPEQMVGSAGVINVPFAGAVPAAGRTPQAVEQEIARRLLGKANQPQVLLRVTRNASANATVVGEVVNSIRLPLTAKGERLLDALAAAGGTRQPVGRMTLQLTRGERVGAMPLDQVIQDPRQNVALRPGDVITALYQPLSFTALGATGRNEEVFFEASGISLTQALARVGGVQDQRADVQGVFLFRFEDPALLGVDPRALRLTPEGRVPVIYRIDLGNPATFLNAQTFPMRGRDVLYIANAPAAELQKFLQILTSSIYSISSVIALGAR
jgi:polysaccharide export outer membrane protein